MKYKVNIMDRDNDCEVMMRIVISEEQKKLLDHLCSAEGIFAEWVKVEILSEDTPYKDLT